jgi:hypothetical protein
MIQSYLVYLSAYSISVMVLASQPRSHTVPTLKSRVTTTTRQTNHFYTHTQNDARRKNPPPRAPLSQQYRCQGTRRKKRIWSVLGSRTVLHVVHNKRVQLGCYAASKCIDTPLQVSDARCRIRRRCPLTTNVHRRRSRRT